MQIEPGDPLRVARGGIIRLANGATIRVEEGAAIRPQTGGQAAAIPDLPTDGSASAKATAETINAILAALRGVGIIPAT
jgi:hypothetical protein